MRLIDLVTPEELVEEIFKPCDNPQKVEEYKALAAKRAEEMMPFGKAILDAIDRTDNLPNISREGFAEIMATLVHIDIIISRKAPAA